MSTAAAPLIAPVTEKTCRRCGCLKPATGFLTTRYTPDTLTEACKPCILAASAAARRDREARQAHRQKGSVT